MKKLTLLLFLSVWYSASYSQIFHFDAGTSYSKLDLKYRYQGMEEQHYDDPIIACAISTGIEYFEHKYYSFSTDLYYYKSGGKYSKEEESNTHFLFILPSKVSVSYLSLGSAINFYPLNNKFKLQLSLGPKIDYILTSEKDIPLGLIDKSRGLRKFNYGYTAGIGFYYKLNKNVVGINMKYLGRLQKLADQKPSYDSYAYYSGVVSSDQIFMVGLSYSFRIK
jgi:hypothetical protein